MDFINKKEVTNTTYEAENEQYKYSVEATAQSGVVTVVSMNIFEKLEDGRDNHAGYFVLRNDNKTVSIPANQPIVAHTQVFENFLEFLQLDEPVEE